MLSSFLSTRRVCNYIRTSKSEQHRLSSRQYESVSDGLFIESGTPSRLHMLVRVDKSTGQHDYQTRNVTPNYDPISVKNDIFVSTISEKGEKQIQVETCEARDQAAYRFLAVADIPELDSGFDETARFKVFLVGQEHSYACLDVTRDLFEKLCWRLETFRAFRDMLIYMGQRTSEVEVAPPRPRSQLLPSGRGNACELTYALRWVEEHGRKSGCPWSLRQSVIYNKVDLDQDHDCWIYVAPTNAVREDLGQLLNDEETPGRGQSTALHFALMDSAIACWRPYLVYLTEQIGERTAEIKFANPKEAGRLGDAFVDLAAMGMRLKLKTLGDQVTDATLALKANKDTIETVFEVLRESGTAKRAPDLGDDYHSDHGLIVGFMREQLRSVDMILGQLSSLQSKVADCTHIASSFSELSNGQALQELAQAARKESERATGLARKGQRDGAAIKALTVITLIYLPTTVVLDFFSASFIDTSGGDMSLVGKWWLFLVIGVPLTIFTLCAWRLWVWRQGEGYERDDEEKLDVAHTL